MCRMKAPTMSQWTCRSTRLPVRRQTTYRRARCAQCVPAILVLAILVVAARSCHRQSAQNWLFRSALKQASKTRSALKQPNKTRSAQCKKNIVECFALLRMCWVCPDRGFRAPATSAFHLISIIQKIPPSSAPTAAAPKARAIKRENLF